jgi:hypothetical protein
MTTQIPLRPGVLFRADASGAGSIEFPKGRRFERVTFCEALRGTTDDGCAYVRAVWALELAGTAEAKKLLAAWAAAQVGNRLCEEAAAALKRLRKKDGR